MRPGYLALLFATLTACTTSPSQQVAKEGEPGVVCTNEIPTGSSIREKRCTTAEQRDAERRNSDHQIVIQSPNSAVR